MSDPAQSEDFAAYLAPAVLIDSDHPEIIEYARAAVAEVGDDDVAQAVALYYAVRDDIFYDPYEVYLTPDGLRASRCLQRRRGFCVTKGALLAAAARVVGIPSRVGYADVRNHLASQRLTDFMETDIFIYHGYTELFVGGKWVKSTPAFNIEMCQRFGVLPLEFDGRQDSLFHPFDAAGREHMEYLNFRGDHADVPAQEIIDAFMDYYPKAYSESVGIEGDLLAEYEAEQAAKAGR
jgi:transglutaminase-like putative cysteine protease